MQSTGARIAVGVVAIAIVVVGFIALSGGDDSDDSTTQTTPTVAEDTTSADQGGKPADAEGSGGQPAAEVPMIQIKDGEAVGGVQDLSFNAGDTIEFEVESDAAYEIHFHGYDVAQDVEAGGSTEFSVPADIEGVFEVEIEDTATQIASITVNP